MIVLMPCYKKIKSPTAVLLPGSIPYPVKTSVFPLSLSSPLRNSKESENQGYVRFSLGVKSLLAKNFTFPKGPRGIQVSVS